MSLAKFSFQTSGKNHSLTQLSRTRQVPCLLSYFDNPHQFVSPDNKRRPSDFFMTEEEGTVCSNLQPIGGCPSVPVSPNSHKRVICPSCVLFKSTRF